MTAYDLWLFHDEEGIRPPSNYHLCGTCRRSITERQANHGEPWPCGHSGLSIMVMGEGDALALELEREPVAPAGPSFVERLAAHKALKR